MSFSSAKKAVTESKAISLGILATLKDFKTKYGQLNDTHVIAASFLNQGSYQALLHLLTPGIGLDTHSQHEKTHLATQKTVWQRVADLFSLFKTLPYKSGSLFDATTFLVVSEWSRTPFLNAAKGKDHNPFTNSALLAGRRIQKGKVFGASKLIPRTKSELGVAEHIAAPYDYKNKMIATSAQGASFFYPENLIQSLGSVLQVPQFSPFEKTVEVIPGLSA